MDQEKRKRNSQQEKKLKKNKRKFGNIKKRLLHLRHERVRTINRDNNIMAAIQANNKNTKRNL